MKNREFLKKYIVQSLCVIFIFISLFSVINMMEYNKYKQNFNYKISAILESISNEYPDVDKSQLIELLESEEINEDYLKNYGYDIETDSYITQNDLIYTKYFAFKLIILFSGLGLLIYLFMKYCMNNDREIDKIIKMIEDINHKIYDMKIDDISEDKLSILKQEIYKTTVMLKEDAENSLKDKINIKNSLQDISHQIKTPLTSISILLDNLIDDEEMDIDTRNQFIKQIKRDITNITFLIQSILKLSKFEANTIQFIKESIDVDDLIEQTVNNVSNLCDLKGVEIEIQNKCTNKLFCDLRWQSEALTNILKNAVEYSRGGDKVIINCEDNSLYTLIQIKDFGKGMDQEDVQNIFKRFYKGKDAGKDSIGIGLSLSKVIIEEDNGRISVDSTKDKGTTFTIKYFRN